MRLCDALKEKEMDLRLRDRHIAEGEIETSGGGGVPTISAR